MAAYYKKIKGRNYDKKLIDAADSSVQGRGDGRISLNDARKILRTVKDSDDYSDIEKSTMKYIRDHYDFTPEADRWFRGEIRKWAAARGAGAKKAKKTARKTTKPKKAVPAVMPREDGYAAPPVSAQPEPLGTGESPGLLKRIIQFIIIVLILVFIFLMLIPSTRERIRNRISGIVGTAQQQAPPEAKAPVTELQQKTPAPETKAPEKPEESGDYYTVQVKDDLISISEKVLGNYSRWIDLYNANRDVIKNPTMIFPGQKLKLPEAKK